MFRTIHGEVFEGKPSADRFKVTLHDLGHGHREACVQRAIDWAYVGPLHPESINAQIARGERPDEDAEERAEANRRRAARRAKANVRRKCKAQGLDNLLTLTYRANQTDQTLCEAHLKEFLRLMRKNLRGFGYVACFEQQKRGAWHVHLAVQKLPALMEARNGVRVKSFNVVRALWRHVVGDLGGNIDVGRWKGTARKSAAKCAAYISKYVLKMFEAGEDHSKRFRASRCELPKPTQMQFQRASLAEVMELVVSYACEQGQVIATSWLSEFKDVYFIASEPISQPIFRQ